MKEYTKPESTVTEVEIESYMLETSELGMGGQGGGDANGMRNPFSNPFGGNPFGNPFGL